MLWSWIKTSVVGCPNVYVSTGLLNRRNVIKIELLYRNPLGNGDRSTEPPRNTQLTRYIFLLLYLHLRGFQGIWKSWWMVSLRVRIYRIQSSRDTTWRNKVGRLPNRTGTRVTHDYPYVRWTESPSSWHSSNSGHLKERNVYITPYA
jgi:hypothetical protein